MPGENTQLTVLVFTDICDSTALKAQHGALEYKKAAELHNALFESLAAEEKLTLIKNTGDGYLATAGSYAAAVWFALRFQHGMRAMQWPAFPLTTRVGIHAGEVADITTLGQPDLLAPAVDLVARVMSLAVGGQILLTRGPYDEARNFIREHPDTDTGEKPNLAWLSHGWYGFKGADEPLEVFELGADGIAPLVPPPDGEKAWRVGPAAGGKNRTAADSSPIVRILHSSLLAKKLILISAITLGFIAWAIFALTKKTDTLTAGQKEIAASLERSKLTDRAIAAYQERFRHWREQNKELPNKTIADLVRAELAGILKTDAATVKAILDEEAPKLAAALDTPLEKKLSALFVMGRYETVIEEGEKKIVEPAIANLQTMGDAARALFDKDPDKKHLETALRYYTGAAALVDKDKAPGEWADIQQWAAKVLYTLARYSEAEPLMRDVAAIRKQHHGENSRDYSAALSNLAVLLQATDRLNEAEPMFRRSLEIEEASLRPSDSDLAHALNNFAELLTDKNRLGEAEQMLRRALEIDEATYGKSHPIIAVRLNNISLLLQATGHLGEAEQISRRALEINEASYSKSHPRVANSLTTLALLLLETNRMGEAEPMLRRALEINEAIYGNSHPIVARALNNLAGLMKAINKMDEAESMYRRALEIHEASHDKTHSDVATVLNNLAEMLQRTNRLKDAEPMLRRALEILEATYGKSHPKIASTINNIAQLLHATNRLEEAERMFRRAIAIDEANEDRPHPHVAFRLHNLALLLEDLNRLEEAEPLMLRAVEIIEKALGKEHPTARTIRRNYEQLRNKIKK